MEHDPVTNEPILFEVRCYSARSRLELKKRWASVDRRDWRGYVGPLKPGWAVRPGMPVRSMMVAVLLTIAYGIFLIRSDQELSIPLLLAAFTVVALCSGLELSNTRDYLTPTRLVRCYGILGRGRREVPLAAIERVEFDYSGLWPSGEAWKVGDLRIFCPGEVITIAGVPEPEAASQAILNVKNGKLPVGA